ncbi:alpha-ketoacid dehydrogenase subunit beta [Amycolatopsis roodepoortensis]|uniref:Pyruvate dehydrogenase E1 component beta subunit n=1 Tax=Amycolatopsis roodepoortensis TaxID=700274 RepID=A0ABR9L672_9PSEU|nr:transketolase C-terminal domain-containing protein [Amycolatopsis roodepoortensis]MBE1575832.1 pyruvate dehydrogenase E1 component beta subunit [Amycolatopsis roodepoortensis]
MSGLPSPENFGYMHAMNRALHAEMAADEDVFLLGEDVGVGASGVTSGLLPRFGPERVLDTPLSEQAFTSFGTGAAMAGKKPVIEFQISSLIYLVFEQIVNQAHKFSLMTGGQVRIPVTYLVSGSGSRFGWAGQHSDNPYSLLAHAGIKTVVPGLAADAYGLLRAAIQDPDPVAVFAPSPLLGATDVSYAGEEDIVPLGQANVVREGGDLTVVAVGQHVGTAIEVAENLADRVDIEIVDPRTVYPFDWECLRKSVDKTGRLIVIDDSNRMCGLGAEIVATAAEEFDLVAPPRRVCRPDGTVIPYALALDKALVPGAAELTAAVDAALR